MDEIFVAYEKVHASYVDLADALGDIEALKRAIFLQWFQGAEPTFLSGISDLNKNQKQRAFDLANQRVLGCTLDDELRWMLPIYYLIADYTFKGDGIDALLDFCQRRKENPRPKISPSQFVGRGQMGDYWASIAEQD